MAERGKIPYTDEVDPQKPMRDLEEKGGHYLDEEEVVWCGNLI